MYRLFFILLFLILPSIASARDTHIDSRLEQCLPFKDTIIELLQSEDVSSDYFYLAVCESGCKIKSSKAGARGFFQLMPPTFRKYKPGGCSNSDIDNIRCNTIAAARYLKHLQHRFHTLSDVIHAYNMGGHNYERRSKPTQEAKGLSWCVQRRIKLYNSIYK